MSGMRFGLALGGNLAKAMAEELAAAEQGVTRGVRRTARDLQLRFRARTHTANLGPKLERAWRRKDFPRSGASLGAASVVYSAARKIIAAFSGGATIRSRNGFWLAIPTPDAPKARGGGRPTPLDVERRLGIKLRYIYRSSGVHLLVADGMVARSGRRGGFRAATELKANKTLGRRVSLRGITSVVMFWLVRQVRISKRLDLAPDIARAYAELPVNILAEWPNVPNGRSL